MTQSNRLWAAATITIMIVLVVAGWFLGAQPALAAMAQSDTQRMAVEAQIATQQATIAALENEQKNLPALKKTYAELAKSIPGDADSSSFIDGLNSLAVEASVQITGFTVGEPAAYAVPTSAVPTPTSPDAAADPAADPAPQPSTGPSPAPVAISPLITPDNFVLIQIGVDVAGTYDAFLSFVHGLQTGDRLFLVTGISTDAVGDGTVKAHVTGYIYVLAEASS